MTMTKKDYELLASVERASWDFPLSESEQAHIERLADALATTNPLFDRKRFLKGCGLEVSE